MKDHGICHRRELQQKKHFMINIIYVFLCYVCAWWIRTHNKHGRPLLLWILTCMRSTLLSFLRSLQWAAPGSSMLNATAGFLGVSFDLSNLTAALSIFGRWDSPKTATCCMKVFTTHEILRQVGEIRVTCGRFGSYSSAELCLCWPGRQGWYQWVWHS